MKKERMIISHFRFILFNLKIFDGIVTTYLDCSIFIHKKQNDSFSMLHLLESDANCFKSTKYVRCRAWWGNSRQKFSFQSLFIDLALLNLVYQLFLYIWIFHLNLATPWFSTLSGVWNNGFF